MDMQMRSSNFNSSSFYVGPSCPLTLDAYNYLATLTPRDWAWEGLRRNRAYQIEALAHIAAGRTINHMTGRALLTRMQDHRGPADAWALCSFRRSVYDRFARPPRVGAGAWNHAPGRSNGI